VSVGDRAAVEKWVGPESAAFMIEPIMAEGGVRVVDPQFLRLLRALADKHGLMLIFDEIQTGVGRSGHFFAHEKIGVTPDILSVAKGIGGGFPLGACLATENAARGMTVGTHGTTFGGNPLAMACGNAVLDVVLAPGFLEEVERKALLLKQRLAELKDRHPGVIAEIRGDGLLIGIRLETPNADFTSAARAEKLLVVPAAENTVRLLPPLTITDGEIGEVIRRLDAAATRVEEATPRRAAE
jgi:acetylornithine/N-succinyldiaminopimelate aminotransferase